MTDRNQFLQCVREAVAAGNRAGDAAPLEPRGQTGYQGAGPDPLARFVDEFRAAGGQPQTVPDLASAVSQVLALVTARSAKRVLLGRGPLLDRLDLPAELAQSGIEVRLADALPENPWDTLFAADIGISEPDHLVAETGSIIQLTRPETPRSVSLLPPIHIVVAERSHLLPDLFDLFPLLPSEDGTLPSCISVITGPSKTGDIELKLVTGVHGPGEVHAILVA